MLKRISRIKNIGRFKEASCGGCEFDKITVIYGRNTYGKSTLGDIFSSLRSGNVDAIGKRRTIPVDDTDQEAIFSFMGAGPSEVPISLGRVGWDRNLPDGLSLQVFDDGFYHDNVFSSRRFNRETKANLSAFILGQQGVAMALEIAEKNKAKGDATRRKNTLQKDVFHGIQDIPQFISVIVDEPSQKIEEKIDLLRAQLSNLARQQSNVEVIKVRPILNTVTCNTDFVKTVEPINKILSSAIESHHEAASGMVHDHITNNLSGAGAESWIAQGMSLSASDLCGFCGQALVEEAARLIDAYKVFFNQAYIENEKLVSVDLGNFLHEFQTDKSSQIKAIFEMNVLVSGQYPELNDNAAFSDMKERYSTCVNELSPLLESYARELSSASVLIQESVDAKRLAPHDPVDEISGNQVTSLSEKIIQAVEQTNIIVDALNNQIAIFKDSLDRESLRQKVAEINQQVATEEIKVKRLNLDLQCQEYNDVLQMISGLEQEIPTLQENLNSQQSHFLQSYFISLNGYFGDFGSNNFSLIQGIDTSGHVPVYYLKVKFQGIDIPERDLDCVFSESDRRALALAIYAASIDAMAVADRLNCIVVMDDPVTSFDNHRMSAIHRYLVNLADQVRQVIVLSHFADDVVRFLHTYRKNKPIKLLEISTLAGFSSLSNPDVDEFLRDEHEQKRESIFRFIDEQCINHSCSDLRVFLEVELAYRFAKQIRDHRIVADDLSGRIDLLCEHNVITQNIAAKLHGWREDLNPAHHRWTGSDIDDQRHTARLFMDFLYRALRPVDVAI